MAEPSRLPSRLSQIGTEWTVLREAHADTQQALAAQSALMMRYQSAIRRYLRGCLRDEDAAEEVFQDFALRLLRGDFRRVDPQKGRFRDYLKVVLSRMVHQYRQKQQKHPTQVDPNVPELSDPADAAADVGEFDESWRTELLDRAWQRLEEHQQRTGQPYYQVLRYRTEHPEVKSEEMAAKIPVRDTNTSKQLTATAVRKLLQRARTAYANYLLQEVAASIGSDSINEIEEELVQLQLLPYCQKALRTSSD